MQASTMLHDIISCTALLLLCCLFCVTTSCTGSHTHYTLEERERIEIVKARIMKQLKNKVPLNRTESSSARRRIPPAVLRRARAWAREEDEKRRQEEDLDQIVTDNLLVMPHSVSKCTSESGDACVRFNVEDLPRDAVIQKAHLSFFKTNRKAQNFTVTIYTNSTNSSSKVFHIQKSNDLKRGWFGLQISSALQWWQTTHKNSDHDVILQLSCDNCIGRQRRRPVMSFWPTRQPFIEATTVLKVKKRRKRYVDCSSSSSSCCRQALRISLEEVGLINPFPSHIDAFYCTGSCRYRFNGATMHGTFLAYTNHRPKLCCAPTKYAPISVIYQLPHGVWTKDNIENVQVKECGCA